MPTAGGYRAEMAQRRVRLAVAVAAPAQDRAPGQHPAGVPVPRGDAIELPIRPACRSSTGPAPAQDGSIGAQPACVLSAGRDGLEHTSRRVRPGVPGATPASDLSVGAQAARVPLAHGDVGERTGSRGLPVAAAPALYGAVPPHTARVVDSGGDRGEEASPRLPLPVLVVAPADRGVVGAQPAGVPQSGRHGLERAVGRVGLTEPVVSPAHGGSVRAQSATVNTAGGDRGEGSLGHARPPVRVAPPADRGSVPAHAAAVDSAGRDLGEDPFRRGQLSEVVVPPALDGAPDPQPARVILAGGDRAEDRRRRYQSHRPSEERGDLSARRGLVGAETPGIFTAPVDETPRGQRVDAGRSGIFGDVGESGRRRIRHAEDVPERCRHPGSRHRLLRAEPSRFGLAPERWIQRSEALNERGPPLSSVHIIEHRRRYSSRRFAVNDAHQPHRQLPPLDGLVRAEHTLTARSAFKHPEVIQREHRSPVTIAGDIAVRPHQHRCRLRRDAGFRLLVGFLGAGPWRRRRVHGYDRNQDQCGR